MTNKLCTSNKSTKKQTQNLSNGREGMFQPRPLVSQPPIAQKSQQADLKTLFIQAEKYGHHLSQTQSADISNATAVQPKLEMGNLVKLDTTEVVPIQQAKEQKKPKQQTNSRKRKREETTDKEEKSVAKKPKKEKTTIKPNYPKSLAAKTDLTKQQSEYNSKGRSSMPDSVTSKILEDSQVEGMEHLARDFRKPDELKAGLRELGMSRNHVLADSNIKTGMLVANKNQLNAHNTGNTEEVQKINDATYNFIDQITKRDTGAAADAKNDWSKSVAMGDTKERYDNLDESQKAVSTTSGNLRIADSSINSRIGHGFDPVVNGGRYDQRTMDIFHSWHKYGREAGIPHEIRFNATMPTIDKINNTELTSNLKQGLPRVSDDIGLNKFKPRKKLFYNEV